MVSVQNRKVYGGLLAFMHIPNDILDSLVDNAIYDFISHIIK